MKGRWQGWAAKVCRVRAEPRTRGSAKGGHPPCWRCSRAGLAQSCADSAARAGSRAHWRPWQGREACRRSWLTCRAATAATPADALLPQPAAGGSRGSADRAVPSPACLRPRWCLRSRLQTRAGVEGVAARKPQPPSHVEQSRLEGLTAHAAMQPGPRSLLTAGESGQSGAGRAAPRAGSGCRDGAAKES